MEFKISWNQVKGLAEAYRKHPEKCMRTLQLTGEVIAEDLEDKAKKNIKWTNRTYQARDSIKGSCETTATNVTVKLEGEAYEDETKTKEYFQYLELYHRKKYAILEPTIKDNRQEAINRYANALKSVDLDT